MGCLVTCCATAPEAATVPETPAHRHRCVRTTRGDTAGHSSNGLLKRDDNGSGTPPIRENVQPAPLSDERARVEVRHTRRYTEVTGWL